VTEREWVVCTNPMPMLEFLRGKVSDRKLRLFAVACCRRIWHLLSPMWSRAAVKGRAMVKTAEQYADGKASSKQLRGTRDIAEIVNRTAAGMHDAVALAAEAAHSALANQAFASARQSAVASARACTAECYRDYREVGENDDAAGRAERRAQAALLRDIFGSLPFRAVAVEPAVLSWKGDMVVKLARGVYRERAFTRLPIFADMLEDAGCTDADILAHCRQPGAHVRGCWVIDLLLGKE
jgi:hypothetical protein